MSTVSRYGQGGRQAYGIVSNLTSKSHGGASATPNSGNHAQNLTANTQQKNPKLYKTELCRSWMDHGRCNYGDRCQYAHGEHEKRPIPRHPKYKTAYCQSYHQSGYCPYGPRCHFIHNEDSSGLSRSSLSNPYLTQASNNALLLSLNNNLHQSCGSAGESPVPSSAGSGSDSPLGSASPSLDLDESTNVSSMSSWNAFSENFNSVKRSHFEWPPVVMDDDNSVLDQKISLQSTGPLCSQQIYNSNSTLLLTNDLLAWNFDDKSVGKAPNVTAANTVRLPVFAQFSNSHVDA